MAYISQKRTALCSVSRSRTLPLSRSRFSLARSLTHSTQNGRVHFYYLSVAMVSHKTKCSMCPFILWDDGDSSAGEALKLLYRPRSLSLAFTKITCNNLFCYSREHIAPVICVTSAMDNTIIISGSEDSSIILSSFSTGKLVCNAFPKHFISASLFLFCQLLCHFSVCFHFGSFFCFSTGNYYTVIDSVCATDSIR